MYFIKDGKVNVLSRDETSVTVSLEKSSYFGEIALLSKYAKRMCSVQAVTFCQIFILTKKDIDSILEKFPLLKQDFLIEGT